MPYKMKLEGTRVPTEHAYGKEWRHDICWGQANLFETVAMSREDVCMERFITDYLKGFLRQELDRGTVRYAASGGTDLLYLFTRHEEYTLPVGETDVYSDEAYWMGMFYSEYQWYWNVSSRDLVEWLPVSELHKLYPEYKGRNMFRIVTEISPEELPCYSGGSVDAS